jgi:hypothetical protein
MTAQKSAKKRPYQCSGHYAVSKALESVKDQEKWLNDQGPLGEALRQLRGDLIAKQGGKETITPAELMAIEGLVFCHMLMMSAGRFIGEQESPVNKSRRQLFPVVTQWLTLFREIRETAKDLNVLRKDRPKPDPLTLSDYLTNGNGKAKAPCTKEAPPSSDGSGEIQIKHSEGKEADA